MQKSFSIPRWRTAQRVEKPRSHERQIDRETRHCPKEYPPGKEMEQGKQSIDEIYLAALEKPTDEERSAFLAHACAGDEELRQRIERLLRAQPKIGSFLETPAPEL